MDNNNLFQQSKYLSAFLASNIGAIVKTVTLTPMDVIMTRLYNQGIKFEFFFFHDFFYTAVCGIQRDAHSSVVKGI